MSGDFGTYFEKLTGHPQPHDWQRVLAEDGACRSRLIRVPTGLGKTEGVLAAWLWHRVVGGDPAWPRRLVWCLPMRTLVEQMAERAQHLARQVPEVAGDVDRPAVHQLMGGVELDDWHLAPERPAVLVGTQDMLLSRALNRGYAEGRARWPVDFALLNRDCLWVMDEVQLMDVGLATSLQLQAFRDGLGEASAPQQDTRRGLGGSVVSWWMSATLQPDWLKSADFAEQLDALKQEQLTVPSPDHDTPTWQANKRLTQQSVPAKDSNATEVIAEQAIQVHWQAKPGKQGRVTLVVVNQVDRAMAIEQAIHKQLADGQGEAGGDDTAAHDDTKPQVELVHSRFRGAERAAWPERFLSKGHCRDEATNLIIVATQVVEAGVDISASALVMELAPWSSLVQRLGRVARYGGSADVIVLDRDYEEKSARPYDLDALTAARDAVDSLIDQQGDAGIEAMETFEQSLDAQTLARLYPYEPAHRLTWRECRELFDTEPDLTGADLDISRFIRDPRDDRNVWVFWRSGLIDDEDAVQQQAQPSRHELCPVPIEAAKKWLVTKQHVAWKQGQDKKQRPVAYTWDYVDGAWRWLHPEHLVPGRTVMVEAKYGGYDIERGFVGKSGKYAVPTVEQAASQQHADRKQADDPDNAHRSDGLSANDHWQTIATHGQQVGADAYQLASDLALPEWCQRLLNQAGRLHDWGKAHAAFQCNMQADDRPESEELAKGPAKTWLDYRRREYAWPEANTTSQQPHEKYGRRKGLRHELASALALMELLARQDQDHPALLGDLGELLNQGVLDREALEPLPEPNAVAEELAELEAQTFNLLAYLVCAHHGKTRATWRATPHDQSFNPNGTTVGRGQPLRGIRGDDPLPAIRLIDAHGNAVVMPSIKLHLAPASLGLSPRYGPSWSERMTELAEAFGPFDLAYLEALLRIADIRTSKQPAERDPLLDAQTKAVS